MTFAGEAVELDYANVISGTPFDDFGDAMRWKYDGGTTTVTAGDSFIAGFFESASLVSGEAVEFTFALVVSGSGSLRLSGGTDPDFALDDPGDAPTDLGTFAVTGAQTIQSGVLPRDVDDYLAQAVETIVFVECLSGSVTIEQVKLYIHPPGGPIGGYVTAPGFTLEVEPQFRFTGSEATGLDTTGYIDTEPVAPFNSAAADLVALWGSNSHALTTDDAVAATLSGAITAGVAVGVFTLLPVLQFRGAGFVDMAGGIAQQPDPDAVTRTNTPTYGESADVVFSPFEVPGDLGVVLLGTPTTAWGAATIDSYGYTSADVDGVQPYYDITAIPDDAIDPANRPSYSHTATPSIPLPTSPPAPGASVTLPDARTVLMSMGADILITPPTYVSEGGLGECDYSVIIDGFSVAIGASTVTIPAYRYWSPTATVVPPLRQRNRGRPRARLHADRQRSVRARGFL